MGILKKIGKLLLGKNDLEEKSLSPHFISLYKVCQPYTMTSRERMLALYDAVNYVLDNNIKGDFVECGVWKGGSSLLMALILKERNCTDRKIYMYDTYEGMSEPTEEDIAVDGSLAANQLREQSKEKSDSVWCYSSIDEVKHNIASSGIDLSLIEFVIGKVEETIPDTIPADNIALLRLDTDWYESTKHELEYLFPKLVNRGVMIIDDYGHWQGSKKAVDEYFDKMNVRPFLHRVDYTGRIMLKY